MILLIKCYRILATLRKERLALSKGGKGGYILNANDVILHLLDMVIAEKEKNFMLQQQQQKQQSEQMQDEKSSKD